MAFKIGVSSVQSHLLVAELLFQFHTELLHYNITVILDALETGNVLVLL